MCGSNFKWTQQFKRTKCRSATFLLEIEIDYIIKKNEMFGRFDFDWVKFWLVSPEWWLTDCCYNCCVPQIVTPQIVTFAKCFENVSVRQFLIFNCLGYFLLQFISIFTLNRFILYHPRPSKSNNNYEVLSWLLVRNTIIIDVKSLTLFRTFTVVIAKLLWSTNRNRQFWIRFTFYWQFSNLVISLIDHTTE